MSFYSFKFLTRLLVCLFLFVVGGLAQPVHAALNIYLSPSGSDARDGLSATNSILTLKRAQQIIKNKTTGANTDVKVLIAPGIYHDQKVTWSYTMPKHKIEFVSTSSTKRPVFRGSGGTFFTLTSRGARTNLTFSFLRIEYYDTAISFNGSRDDLAAYNGGNTIHRCYFYRIGQYYTNSKNRSTAVVRFVNSDGNTVQSNHFIAADNITSRSALHFLYIAHNSSDNLISKNQFNKIYGFPVKVRDNSNNNVITKNRFIRTYTHAFQDWYCHSGQRPDCTKKTPECPSWDNQFTYNRLESAYDSGRLGAFVIDPKDERSSACKKPKSSSRRLRTTGNTRP